MRKHVLVIGRWHAVTRDQEKALHASLREIGAEHVIFLITAADQSNTKRHPLSVEERRELLEATARNLGCPFDVYGINDTTNNAWVKFIEDSVCTESKGATVMNSMNTVLVSANPDVIGHFEAAGYSVKRTPFEGTMPADILAAIRTGKKWQHLVNDATQSVYKKHGLDKRIMDIFEDVLLTDDGELSVGRDFMVYGAGMDASLALKIDDIVRWIRRGRIVDKGCGTGALLVHLSQMFRDSQIIGMDLSRELLRMAESQHFPFHNVSVVKGNIIHQRFAPKSVSTIIYSSVIHEVYSYSDYDIEQVRLALSNSHTELETGGHLIVRDGVKPPRPSDLVWMRCDGETDERFRRFAHDFKRASKNPGVRFVERTHAGENWFVLSLHDANEFLSKKDYLKNWDIETKEEFGVWTLDEWRTELKALGYEVVHAQSYLNDWIKVNRYDGRVRLRADRSNRPGRILQFPDTTGVIVGRAA